MGVQGLWQLLQPAGKPVSLESLEGKILAVDVSIWLHQAAKGMRDKDGNPLPNAHLHSLFIRLCKLLFYRIKPVFVFDGGVPILKKQTLAARRERKEEAEEESGRATKKLLQNLIRSQAVKTALGQPGEGNSAAALAAPRSKSKGPDLFELPPLPETDKESTSALNYDEEEEDAWEDQLQYQRIIEEEFQSLENIDIESEEFKSLPSEIKHEILTEMKEVRKRRRLGRVGPMPDASDDFSAFQLAKLVKQSTLTNHIEAVRKEMKVGNTADFSQAVSKEYMTGEFETHRVVSEDASHYILIKGLSKQHQLEQAAKYKDEKDGQIDVQIKTEVKDQAEKATKYEDPSHSGDLQNLKKEGDGFFADSTDTKDADNVPLQVKHMKVPKSVEDEKKDAGDFISLQELKKQHQLEEAAECEHIVEEVESEALRHTSKEEREALEEADDLLIECEKDERETPAVDSRERDCCINVGPDLFNTDSKMESSESEDEDISLRESQKAGVIVSDATNKKELGLSGSTASLKRKPADEEVSQEKSKVSKVDDTKFPNLQKRDEENVVSSDSDGDEGFIEISVDPGRAKEDDLFPAEMFDVVKDKTPSSVKDEIHMIGNQKAKVASVFVGDSEAKIAINEAEERSRPVPDFDIGDYQFDESEDKAKEEVAPPGVYEDTSSSVNEFKGMTVENLENLQEELETESETLRAERGRQERLATSISDQMNVEAQELLELFGVPYVVSPMEAEAQCAQLDILGLTHGTITDDSDIWLFGGTRVYRNFFNQKKTVQCFSVTSVQSQFGLDRDKLICLAYLLGSDYTEGIQGVGPVTGIEILGEFPGPGIEGLVNLKSWWDEAQALGKKFVTSKLKSKVRDLEIKEGFPNPTVKDAYLHPTVDESSETFSWGSPDLDLLRDYASSKMGWNKQKTDELVLPVLKQLNKKETQSKINTFLQPEYFMEPQKNISKRVKQALNKVKGVHNTEVPQQKSNYEKLEKAKEVLGVTKGQGRGRGRGRGKGKVTGKVTQVKVKDEVDLSESSSSDEGGFVREVDEDSLDEGGKGKGDGKSKTSKGKGRGKNRKFVNSSN